MKDLKEWLKILYKNIVYWSVIIFISIIGFGLIFIIRLYLAGGNAECVFSNDPVICKVIKEKGID